jgi:hypothetical protein
MPGFSVSLTRRVGQRPLKDSRTKVSPASTIPLGTRGFVGARAEKPMAPAKRRCRMDAAQLSGLGQTFALDPRPGVIEPALLLAQMRHRGVGQRVARSSCSETAKAHASGPSRRSLGLHSADSPGSPRACDWLFRARPRDGCRAPSLDPAPNLPSRDPSFPTRRLQSSRRCRALNPAIAESPSEKSAARIESTPRPDALWPIPTASLTL